ncbi:hypothetical protein LMANV2_410076 [Leptospira interrogans serovar Manilae]|uniref:Uncharacterized protein n=1 Tax=Leptospira interrogans serovar Manilae TaxID=214675 RepID=A0AAQ1NZK9_LEPIR|nr:hypothetical protein LMANV2_410076 [Leptospira interrogans serovar Manilae]
MLPIVRVLGLTQKSLSHWILSSLRETALYDRHLGTQFYRDQSDLGT